MFRPRFVSLILLTAFILTGCSNVVEEKLTRARASQAQGNFEQALTQYQAILPHAGAEEQVAVNLGIAECLWQMQRRTEALAAFERVLSADPVNVRAHVQTAEIYLSAGALRQAAEHLVVAQAVAPEDPEVLMVDAAIKAGTGKLDEAQRLFARVLTIDPHRTSVAVALADFHYRLDQTEEARATLLKSAAANPRSAEPLLALARLEEQEGNAPAAEEAYRKAVQAEDIPHSNLRLAQFLQRASRITEAEEILQRLDERREKGSTFLADFQLSSGKVTDALGRYLKSLGTAQDGNNQATQDAAVIARLIEADLNASQQSDVGASARLSLARAHLNNYRDQLDDTTANILESEIAFAEGDVARAREHAEAAVVAAPQSAAARYVLGMALQAAGDPVNARSEWLNAVEKEGNFVPVRLVLAQQELAAGDAGRAEEHAATVVRVEPGNLRGLLLYSRSLLAQGNTDAALSVAKRAEAVNPQSVEPFILQGEIAVASGRYAEALVRFQQAVLLDAHSEAAIDGLMSVYRRGKINPKVLRQMEAVAAAPPTSPTLMEIVGRLYAERGMYADAARTLEQALKMDSLRGSAALALARAYSEGGADERATQSLQRVNQRTALLLAALRAQEQNRPQAAIRDYESLLRYDSASEVVNNNLAWLYAERGEKLDRALELANAARRVKSHDPAILHTLGYVHMQRREYSDAIDVLNEAEKNSLKRDIAPEVRAAIRRDLAEAYLRTGDVEAAARLRALQP